MSRPRPILDAETKDAAILGFATTLTGAYRVASRAVAKHARDGGEPVGLWHLRPIAIDGLAFDPDVNTRKDHDRACRVAYGWVVATGSEG